MTYLLFSAAAKPAMRSGECTHTHTHTHTHVEMCGGGKGLGF